MPLYYFGTVMSQVRITLANQSIPSPYCPQSQPTNPLKPIHYYSLIYPDIDEYDMPQSSINLLRMNYREDVRYTLSRIKTRCPSCYIALAGPEMIGEGPLFPVRTTPSILPCCTLTTSQYSLSCTIQRTLHLTLSHTL